MNVASLASDLRAEARRTDQRRLLVLAGDRADAMATATDALDAADVPPAETTVVSTQDHEDYEQIRPTHAHHLLGTTRQAIVVDAHAEFSPNALGRVVGAVDGGGLFVLLTPPLEDWPERRDDFDEGLAVPPFGLDDVTGNFRERLATTLRQHPGIAIVDSDTDTVERDGLTDDPPRPATRAPTVPSGHDFPRAAYQACLTQDQVAALDSLEALREPGNAVVVEADRGRGKSSAAGLAAGCLAADGHDVLVTAPEFRSAAELFARARDLLRTTAEFADESAERHLQTSDGGHVRFEKPPSAATLPANPDVVLVDEAAAIPVRLLTDFLDAPAVGFFSTVHGYEGAGRGFAVRFRDRLAESHFDVADVHLAEPIRYARDDPVESWAFRALLLDARPAVDQVVEGATPETVEYQEFTAEELLADEHLLREVFGLLVLAHYRTEPNDLARLLDAPNLSVRALTYDGWVVSVALLAREGGLDAETRAAMYEGSRVRGNMLPDVLTSQLRDEHAGVPVGYRVMRIATHHAVRSEGLGSRLLATLEREFERQADWLGVGYGATPELLSFWRANGYHTVHLSTTRNDTSGEYSALMLRPLRQVGHDLHDRHAEWFRDRIAGVLSDPLRDMDPDVVRGALQAVDATPSLDLSPMDWRAVVGASYGPGLADVSPHAFRDVVVAGLIADVGDLTPEQERLLVRKALQGHRWDAIADELDFASPGQCMRAFGEALQPLVDAFGTGTAREERRRFE